MATYIYKLENVQTIDGIEIELSPLKIKYMSQEFSMDNPPICTFPHLRIGDVFTFNGYRCIVTKKETNGFDFKVEHSNQPFNGWMSYAFYMETPSAKGRRL